MCMYCRQSADNTAGRLKPSRCVDIGEQPHSVKCDCLLGVQCFYCVWDAAQCHGLALVISTLMSQDGAVGKDKRCIDFFCVCACSSRGNQGKMAL